MSKTNFRDLQRDTIDLLSTAVTLVATAKELMGVSSKVGANSKKSNRTIDEGEHFANWTKILQNEIRKIEKLELPVAIVAPMKAGKSTIVNALLAREILPTHNSAMTSLPTEIVAVPGLTTPEMVLSKGFLRNFSKGVQEFYKEVARLGLDEARSRISNYPHLTPLLGKRGPQIEFQDRGSFIGEADIHAALNYINSINRLCLRLTPASAPVRLLGGEDLPRIQAPIAGAKLEVDGSLVIVDTPGPNEWTDGLDLSGVVGEQLNRCSVVLLVLDFTQLNTEAAVKLKEQITPILAKLGSKRPDKTKTREATSLVVVVNKVDQRQNGDMTPKQVREFVASHLGIERLDRLYEVSARGAYDAAVFLRQARDAVAAGQPVAEELVDDFLRHYSPNAWQDLKSLLTPQMIVMKAEEFWQKCGFQTFLDNTILALMQRVGPQALGVALNVVGGVLGQVGQESAFRASALATKTDLRASIRELESDLEALDAMKANLIKLIEGGKKNLTSSTRQLGASLQQQAALDLKSILGKEDRTNFLEKALQGAKSLVSKGHKNRVLIFGQKKEAESFISQAIIACEEMARAAIVKRQSEIGEVVEDYRESIAESLEESLNPILEKAKDKLEESFKVKLGLPSFKTSPLPLPVIEVEPRHTVRIKEGKIHQESRYGRTWRRLWLWPSHYTVAVKQPDREIEEFQADLGEIINQVNSWIASNVDELRQQIDNFADEEFNNVLEDYFGKAEKYLDRYRNHLIRAREQQELTQIEQDELLEHLAGVIEDTERLAERATQLEGWLREGEFN